MLTCCNKIWAHLVNAGETSIICTAQQKRIRWSHCIGHYGQGKIEITLFIFATHSYSHCIIKNKKKLLLTFCLLFFFFFKTPQLKFSSGPGELMFTIINPVCTILADLIISCKLDLNASFSASSHLKLFRLSCSMNIGPSKHTPGNVGNIVLKINFRYAV